MAGILVAIRVVWQKPIHRKTERIRVKNNVTCAVRYKRKLIYANVKDISSQGACLEICRDIKFKTGQRLYLDFGKVQICCRVIRSCEHDFGVKFEKVPPEIMKHIMLLVCENMEAYYKIIRNEDEVRRTDRNPVRNLLFER